MASLATQPTGLWLAALSHLGKVAPSRSQLRKSLAAASKTPTAAPWGGLNAVGAHQLGDLGGSTALVPRLQRLGHQCLRRPWRRLAMEAISIYLEMLEVARVHTNLLH